MLKRLHINVIVLGFATLSISHPSHAGDAPQSPQHYFDSEGSAIPDLESVWSLLHDFFRNTMPRRIGVEVHDDFGGMFDCRTNTIILRRRRFEQERFFTVGHETSHLALCNLMRGRNTLDEYRFLDEGFATIQEYRAGGQEAGMKRRMFSVARAELVAGNVRFEVVQDWRRYFGDPATDPTNLNFDAYLVGASFDYLLFETFGEERFRAFLMLIGSGSSLEVALSETFGWSKEQAERAWQTWLTL